MRLSTCSAPFRLLPPNHLRDRGILRGSDGFRCWGPTNMALHMKKAAQDSNERLRPPREGEPDLLWFAED